MKKVLFIAVLAVLHITAVQAQFTNKPAKSIQKTIVKSPQQQPPAVVSVYSLTAVRVNIRTGSDNKEFPSKIYVTLMVKTKPHYYIYQQSNLSNEMRINSDTEFGLERQSEGTPERITLEALQNAGLILQIYYAPNLITDAWKIDNISMVLEFKDQNGNLHPSLGRKTVVFNNAYGFLNAGVRYMECITDQSFSPLTAVIK